MWNKIVNLNWAAIVSTAIVTVILLAIVQGIFFPAPLSERVSSRCSIIVQGFGSGSNERLKIVSLDEEVLKTYTRKELAAKIDYDKYYTKPGSKGRFAGVGTVQYKNCEIEYSLRGTGSACYIHRIIVK